MNNLLKRAYDSTPAFFQNWALSGYSALLDRQRYGTKFHTLQKEMSQTERLSKSDLIAYQDEKLRHIIQHAHATVPYYRRIFNEHKLTVGDIQSQNDLVKLPTMTKHDIKNNFRDLISTSVKQKDLKYGHTSGTTGSPLEVGYDSNVIAATYAALDRQYQWADCRLSRKQGDRIAVIRGNVIVPLSQHKPPFWRYNKIHNQILLSAFHMSRENLPRYFQELDNYSPAVLDGYPSTLYVLAKFLKNEGIKFPVKTVISSSETLYDFQREVIEESFCCNIFDYYALAERVVFATECNKHEGQHFTMEYGIAEIINDRNEPCSLDEPGKLVGTSLHNFGMPLIRYITNDMTAICSRICSCGRELDLMDAVTTKAEDSLTLKDGRIISPSVLTHPFKPLHGIEESQIIQKELDFIEIRIVPKTGFSEQEANSLITAMIERLGSDIHIELKIVDKIERTAQGKLRWVISEVPLGV
jgi:phenylacetate-CoA ligase